MSYFIYSGGGNLRNRNNLFQIDLSNNTENGEKGNITKNNDKSKKKEEDGNESDKDIDRGNAPW